MQVNQRVLFTTVGGYFAVALTLALLSLAPEPMRSHQELFRDGAKATLELTFLASLFGLIFGLIIAWIRFFSIPFLYRMATFFLDIIRGTPLLVQILFAYYALPLFLPQLSLNEFWAATIALSFNVAAYHSEVIRGGMLSIPKGQWDAAHVLGFNRRQAFQWVIWPQSLRVMLPGLVCNTVALLKDSALASSIGLLELSLAGNRVTSETFQPTKVLLTVALIYFVFSSIVTRLGIVLESGFRWAP